MPINNSTLPAREEYLRKKRNRRIIKYIIIFLTVVVFVGLSSYGANRKEVRVSKVILQGGLLITQTDIGERSLDFMKGSYVWLYPKDVSFWYPRKALEKYLTENFKRIDTISIKLEGLNTMIVKIKEREPFGIWCDSLPGQYIVSTTTQMEDGSHTQKCYFLDQNSTIFSEAPYFSGDAYFKYYGLIATTTPIGSYYMAEATQFNEINDFIDRVRGMSVRPLHLTTKDDDFSLVVAGGGQIYFDIKKPLSEVAQNLESLLRTSALSTTTHKELPVEYIDLRYGNKLFYKLKNEQ